MASPFEGIDSPSVQISFKGREWGGEERNGEGEGGDGRNGRGIDTF